MDELKKGREEIAESNPDEQIKTLEWYKNSFHGLYNQRFAKMDEISKESARINSIYMEKMFGKLCPSCGRYSGSGAKFCGYCRYQFEGSSDNPKEKTKEERAIEELGIAKAEYDNIIGNISGIGNSELIRLTMKVVGANSEAEIKQKYRQCLSKWHPDKKNTQYGIGVNGEKSRIANNLYGEYEKRLKNNRN